jgi:uncharacterized membrane protein
MKQLLRYVFVGSLALIPLFIVVQVILWINRLSIDLFYGISQYTNNQFYTAGVIILTLTIIIIIGYTTERFGKSIFVSTIEKIFENIPALNTIYSIVKKITELFISKGKDEKKEVVLFEFLKDDTWVVAYVLNKYKDKYVLFVPTSPNPTSGYTVITKKENVQKTTLSIAEASQFIVSMGVDFIKKDEISAIIDNKFKIIKEEA